jgi:hypothetical protein
LPGNALHWTSRAEKSVVRTAHQGRHVIPGTISRIRTITVAQLLRAQFEFRTFSMVIIRRTRVSLGFCSRELLYRVSQKSALHIRGIKTGQKPRQNLLAKSAKLELRGGSDMQDINLCGFWWLTPQCKEKAMSDIVDGMDGYAGFGTRMRQDFLKGNEAYWQRRWQEESLPKLVDLNLLADIVEQSPGHFKREFNRCNLGHDVIVHINQVLDIPNEQLPNNVPEPLRNLIGLAQAVPMFVQDRQTNRITHTKSRKPRSQQRRPRCPPLDYAGMALCIALYDDAATLSEWFRLIASYNGHAKSIFTADEHGHFFDYLWRKAKEIAEGDDSTICRLKTLIPSDGNLRLLAHTLLNYWNAYQVDVVMTWEGVSGLMQRQIDLPEIDAPLGHLLPISREPEVFDSITLPYRQDANKKLG